MTHENKTLIGIRAAGPDSPHYPALEIDYAFYERFLEDADLTDEQKRDFIETIWSIIVSFVDLGFGLHPLQQTGRPVDSPEEFLPPESAEMIGSLDIAKINFKRASGVSKGGRARKESHNE
ncbi:hypothetical protein IWQ54_006476 [Labrenzia sp. EL_195]|nr:hypothetical protein [Labrenzia sp. EL_195]